MHYRILACGLFVVFAASGAVRGEVGGSFEGGYYDDLGYDQRLQALEARLDRMAAETHSATSASCDAGGGCCEPCSSCSAGWYGGGAVVFAQPYLRSNVAYIVRNDTVQPRTFEATTFEYDFDASWRVWIGYQNECGRGIRARYWRFEDEQSVDTPVNPGGGTMIRTEAGLVDTDVITGFSSPQGFNQTVTQGIEMDVADLEATTRFCWCGGTWTASGGVRYVHYEQSFLIQVVSPLDFGLSDFEFDGAGPTLGLEVWLPTGCDHLAWYGSARGSALLGRFRQRLASAAGGDVFEGRTRSDHAVAALEGELGLEWSRNVSCGTLLFARGGVEGQVWSELAHVGNDLANLGFLGIVGQVGLRR